MNFKFKTYEPEHDIYSEALVDLDFFVSAGFYYDGEDLHRDHLEVSLSNGFCYILCVDIDSFEKMLKKNKIHIKNNFLFSKS